MIPIIPELHAVLMPAFEAASEGAEFVVSGYRDATSANVRTQALRPIARADLKPWPRLFNALRASRATELAGEYPAALCTSWMGHTQQIAEGHYHMVRDEDFERVSITSMASAAQQRAETGVNESQIEGLAPPQWLLRGVCRSVQPRATGRNGRNRTRTCDLCHVTAAL